MDHPIPSSSPPKTSISVLVRLHPTEAPETPDLHSLYVSSPPPPSAFPRQLLVWYLTTPPPPSQKHRFRSWILHAPWDLVKLTISTLCMSCHLLRLPALSQICSLSWIISSPPPPPQKTSILVSAPLHPTEAPETPELVPLYVSSPASPPGAFPVLLLVLNLTILPHSSQNVDFGLGSSTLH